MHTGAAVLRRERPLTVACRIVNGIVAGWPLVSQAAGPNWRLKRSEAARGACTMVEIFRGRGRPRVPQPSPTEPSTLSVSAPKALPEIERTVSEIGAKVAKARAERGWALAQLAERAGLA